MPGSEALPPRKAGRSGKGPVQAMPGGALHRFGFLISAFSILEGSGGS
ncbi:hypothetical protein [Rhodopila globiformis]|nr:hypothetical protein [Rhodopila globiformis]